MTSGYYCTVHREDEENVLFNLVSAGAASVGGLTIIYCNPIILFEVSPDAFLYIVCSDIFFLPQGVPGF